jgi:hypothetical protein
MNNATRSEIQRIMAAKAAPAPIHTDIPCNQQECNKIFDALTAAGLEPDVDFCVIYGRKWAIKAVRVTKKMGN